MREWGRRLGCLLLFLLWLVVMSLPLLSVVLAARGQIQLGGEEGAQARIFLLQERNVEGVGVEWSRPLRREPGCRRTAVLYLMWRGQGENIRFTSCEPEANLKKLPTTTSPYSPNSLYKPAKAFC
jgi:hypothetical protein